MSWRKCEWEIKKIINVSQSWSQIKPLPPPCFFVFIYYTVIPSYFITLLLIYKNNQAHIQQNTPISYIYNHRAYSIWGALLKISSYLIDSESTFDTSSKWGHREWLWLVSWAELSCPFQRWAVTPLPIRANISYKRDYLPLVDLAVSYKRLTSNSIPLQTTLIINGLWQRYNRNAYEKVILFLY